MRRLYALLLILPAFSAAERCDPRYYDATEYITPEQEVKDVRITDTDVTFKTLSGDAWEEQQHPARMVKAAPRDRQAVSFSYRRYSIQGRQPAYLAYCDKEFMDLDHVNLYLSEATLFKEEVPSYEAN